MKGSYRFSINLHQIFKKMRPFETWNYEEVEDAFGIY
jgi:hypothetical protein